MKNKSFKNYYDEIQVDENLLQQIPIKKHHYYKPILIISCVVLLFVLGIQNKETKDTFEILAYNQTNKNKKNDPDRIELNKYCKFCKKHTLHKETK